jgi:hypothetical protein
MPRRFCTLSHGDIQIRPSANEIEIEVYRFGSQAPYVSACRSR